MYKEETYSPRSVEEVKHDIDSMAAVGNKLTTVSQRLGYGGEINRTVFQEVMSSEPLSGYSHGFVMIANWMISGGKTAFLQDGNSVNLKTEKLVEILTHLRQTFPSLERVTTYARAKTMAKKTPEELLAIREAGLDRLHVGLETGDDELLVKIKKGVTSAEQIVAGRKAMEAGFELSEYWMPGLGGKELWEQHASNTARVLNEINPHYARSRPFYPAPGTPMADSLEKGEYHLLSPLGVLAEIRLLVSELNCSSRICFDHDGNRWTDENGRRLFDLSYEGYKFPEEKAQVLQLIERGLGVNIYS
jgi:hypothetical protein